MAAVGGKIHHLLVILVLLFMWALVGAAVENKEDDIYEGNSEDKHYAPKGGNKPKPKIKKAEKTEDKYYLPIGGLGDEELIFNSNTIIAKPKENIQLRCGIKGHKEEPRYCVWENGSNTYQVEDVYSGVYDRMGRPKKAKNNQCGIVLKKASTEDSGTWKCTIFITGRALVGKKSVIINIKDEL